MRIDPRTVPIPDTTTGEVGAAPDQDAPDAFDALLSKNELEPGCDPAQSAGNRSALDTLRRGAGGAPERDNPGGTDAAAAPTGPPGTSPTVATDALAAALGLVPVVAALSVSEDAAPAPVSADPPADPGAVHLPHDGVAPAVFVTGTPGGAAPDDGAPDEGASGASGAVHLPHDGVAPAVFVTGAPGGDAPDDGAVAAAGGPAAPAVLATPPMAPAPPDESARPHIGTAAPMDPPVPSAPVAETRPAPREGLPGPAAPPPPAPPEPGTTFAVDVGEATPATVADGPPSESTRVAPRTSAGAPPVPGALEPSDTAAAGPNGLPESAASGLARLAPGTAPPASSPAPRPSAPAPTPAAQLAQAIGPLRRGPDGSHRLTVELSPPELGRVRLEVRLNDGVVSVRVHAASAASGDALRDSLAELRRNLEESGLRAGTLVVAHEQPDGNAPHRREQPEPVPGRDADADVGPAGSVERPTSRTTSDALVDVLL